MEFLSVSEFFSVPIVLWFSWKVQLCELKKFEMERFICFFVTVKGSNLTISSPYLKPRIKEVQNKKE